MKAENGKTATYYVYQGSTAATGNDLAEDILAAIDLTDEDEVAEAIETLKANSIYYTDTVKALNDADAPVAVFVPVLLDEYADAANASNSNSNNAALAQKLISNVDAEKQNDAAVAYVDWLIDELAAKDSSVTNNDSVVITKTAAGYDVELKSATAPSNTGLFGLLNELDSSATLTWPGQTQTSHGTSDFVGQWAAMQTAVLSGVSFPITVTANSATYTVNLHN